MKRIVLTEPGHIEVQETEMPKRREGETLLRLLYGGICGSDLGSYRGANFYITYPRTIGHEFSAVVVETDGASLRPGQLVTCNPYFNCGTCYSCRRGFVNCCVNNQTMGVQREGAFADYITVPTERVYDGEGIDPRELALVEPFCISHHGVSRANIVPDERVLVMGAGAIGILAAVTAKLQGAKVYIADVAPEKLAFVRDHFPVDGCLLNEGGGSIAAAAEEITKGDGFDVTVEAAGVPASFCACVDASAPRGRMVQIGVSKKPADFNFTLLQKKELCVMGSRAATRGDFAQTMQYVREGRVDLSSLITRTFPAAQAPEAFACLHEHAGSIVKMELDFTL
ncbi:MAG: zinc-binding alcohol dehydrogenase family protein [Candidatus Ventricola sp.]|nr:zinc-binding alcohol dehydrogenase family protein [Candidatus Ventricola sp.]